MKKRILPALLALCMVMSLLPVAFATDCAADTGSGATVGDNDCTASSHQAGCPKKCQATAGCTETVVDGTSYCNTHTCEKTGCTKEKNHTDAHSLSTCTGDDRCNASTHDVGCPKKCACANGTNNGCDHENGCTNSKAANSNFCTACTANQPVACDGTANCKAKTHTATWGNANDEKCAAACMVEGCMLTAGHTEKHGGSTCTNDSRCPHTGDTHQATCPKACGVSGCTKTAGHTKNTAAQGQASNATPHNNTQCLGYNDDGFCGFAGTHIAGCGEYDCECGPHTDTGFNDSQEEGFVALTCTHKAGCPLCAAWNSYVSGKVAEYNAAHKTWKEKKDAHDAWVEAGSSGQEPAQPGAEPTLDGKYVACDCKDCRPNPAMGAVVDAEGNVVDPADPTEPTTPEIPTKAEDFTDMEDWMAADVQVALDKGWMQGVGDSKFDGRAATTGTMVAAVLARMDGEEITGTDWDKDALAWAEGKDVFEGIELTGESMARKDLVLVIWRMADKPESDFELTFTDVDGLEGDHLTAMKWAAENGIVKGNGDDTVTPDGAVNRAALCAMLARYDGLEK